MFACLSTITGDLPPSSRVTPARCREAASITTFPTFGLPVNIIWLKGRFKSFCATSFSPKKTATSSDEKVFSIKAFTSSPEAGVSSEGLIIAVLPDAIAAMSGLRQSITG